MVDAKSGPRKQIQKQKFRPGLPLASWQCDRMASLVGGDRWPLTCCHRTVVQTLPGDELEWEVMHWLLK